MTREPDRRHHDDPTKPRRRREDALELLLTAVRSQLSETQRMRREGSEGFRRYRRRAYLAFAILTAASGLALYLVWQQAQRIQQERERSIRAACVEQNARHDQTIRTLDSRIAVIRATASPARVARLEESRRFTVAIIEALAPKRDCAELVARSVGTD